MANKELKYMKVEDTVFAHFFKEGLSAAYWLRRKDTKEIIGLRLVFVSGAEVFISSKDDSLLNIEIANPDGSVQSNTS